MKEKDSFFEKLQRLISLWNGWRCVVAGAAVALSGVLEGWMSVSAAIYQIWAGLSLQAASKIQMFSGW